MWHLRVSYQAGVDQTLIQKSQVQNFLSHPCAKQQPERAKPKGYTDFNDCKLVNRRPWLSQEIEYGVRCNQPDRL